MLANIQSSINTAIFECHSETGITLHSLLIFSPASKLSASPGLYLLTFSCLSFTECNKAAFLPQSEEGKLTLKCSMDSLDFSLGRPSSGMSGRARINVSHWWYYWNTLRDISLMWTSVRVCGCGYFKLWAEHVPGQPRWWQKQGWGEERKEMRHGDFGV